MANAEFIHITSKEIKNMNVADIIYFLGQDDDFLVTNTIPVSSPETIRDQLIIQYNKLTNSNIMTNAESYNHKNI